MIAFYNVCKVVNCNKKRDHSGSKVWPSEEVSVCEDAKAPQC